jgi:hypothetical protein
VAQEIIAGKHKECKPGSGIHCYKVILHVIRKTRDLICSNRPSSGNGSESKRTLRSLEGCHSDKCSNQVYSTQMTNFLAIKNNAVPLNYATIETSCVLSLLSLVQSHVFELIQMYEAPDVKRFYLQ